MKTQLKDLVATFVASIGANLMGGVVVLNTSVDNLKKGTAKNRSLAYEKFFDPIKGVWRTTKTTRYTNLSFQRNYANACTNRAEDNSTPYIAEKPKGRSWVEGLEGILLVSDTDPNKFYLRVSENKNTTRQTTYFVDGNEATAEEVAIIKEFLPTKKTYVCQKQIENGIAEDNQVIVKDFCVDNIVSIQFGKKVLTLK